jgi:hypothetical protein
MPRSPSAALSAVAAGIAAAAVAAAVLPASALAGSTTHAASGVCPVKVAGVMERTVVVGVNLSDARSSAAPRAACRRVAKVMRSLAAEGAERPETVNGFACTPSITGGRVAWTCTYRGGRPRTTITLAFAYRYPAG